LHNLDRFSAGGFDDLPAFFENFRKIRVGRGKIFPDSDAADRRKSGKKSRIADAGISYGRRHIFAFVN